MLEVLYTDPDSCDTIVIVCGDTDMVPAFETAKRLFQKKKILFAFPYRRSPNILQKLAPESFKLKPKKYVKYQFANPYERSDGTTISKPNKW